MAGDASVEGTPFGRYRLVSLLGEGGMGEVWRAHDTVTDRVVAIKVLPQKLSKDEDFQRRFRREAHAAARLNTPHAVPIHDYGEIDGRLFVSMRLIEGRDLAAVLADGPLEPARAVRIIDQVARALHSAHKVGLIHRDIKPSNILLDEDDFAYLIDFGIARIADDTRLTKTGNTIGTFAYIAPERLDGRGNEDARVDIYSLACVLYECLAGEPPFGGDTMARLVAAHLNSPPPRPSITRSDVPAQVDEVIATGMAKDPDQRYATTTELADAAREAITIPIQRPTPNPTRLRATQPASPPPEPAGDSPTTPATYAAAPQDELPIPHTPAARQSPARPASTTWWRERLAGLITAAIVVLLVGAGIIEYRQRQHSTTSQPSATSTTAVPTTPTGPSPVAEGALQGLLLSPDQINTELGIAGITVTSTYTALNNDTASDKACLPMADAAEGAVYAGSGSGAVRGESLSGPDVVYVVGQFVVLFPSARDAGAFFAASAQQWPACSNRQFAIGTASGDRWAGMNTVGLVTNTNGTLSAARSFDVEGIHRACQRALTVANNVAIDVQTCSRKQQSDARPASAINIAKQIAAKVPTT